ncbi:uncharacterized protein DUF4183 [Fontibacillus phaseoli]|uniref:Uncharacterized protein DUF4183 n=1 Tax=Fontibacillus phaseoli TaxID=1416533 RepID=A0A369B201_9BACL|nr:DUF4183 domain-containing protein [Fontibacillus phaseoli]RCX15355.1 uncharacterized protein DUF4183 [Fontibacillus phaseoli]
MPVIKLHLNAQSIVTGVLNTSTNTNTVPTVNRYTATVVLGNILGSTTVIPATSFTNDSNEAVPAGGLVVPGVNGYYNLYVNGVMQRGGLSSLITANLTINSVLVIGVTVTIEVVNFSSASTSVTTNGLSVSTLIQY